MGDLYNPFPKLPKNVRQIGDPDQVVRLYMEDYVNTYLKQLYPSGKQTMRVGVLLGSTEQYDGTPYIFIDGAMELEDVETDGEKIVFSESSWKKLYPAMESTFPKRTVQGWFLCGGPSSQLSPLNYWKQHSQYFAGKNQLMYLNHGLEGEEAVYVTSEDGFYRLKGHYIYYERNQMMQDYMIMRKDVRRVEPGSHEKVIKDFRQRMTVRKEQAGAKQKTANALGLACGILSVAVLAGGVVLMNNYQKMRQMEGVLASVLPADVSNWQEYQEELAGEPDFIIEEMPGNVYPTEGETGESYTAGGKQDGVWESADGTEGQAGDETGTGVQGQGGSDGQAGQAAGAGAGNSGKSGEDTDTGSGGSSGEGADDVSGDGMSSGEEADAAAGTGGLSGASADAAAGNGGPSEAGADAAVGNHEPSGAADAGGQAEGNDGADLSSHAAAVGSGRESSLAGENSGETGRLVGMGKEIGEGDSAEAAGTPIDYEAAEANGYRVYQIGEGETLYGICWREYGDLSRLTEICELNSLEDVDHILAGQKLILP